MTNNLKEEFDSNMKVKNEMADQMFSPWVTYEVDCDDGTHEDVIYEYKKPEVLPF